MANRLPTEKKIAASSMNCDGNNIRSIERMNEVMDGKPICQEAVEIFDLKAHAKAKRACALAYKNDYGVTQFVSLLKNPPVNSPSDAVLIAIASRKVK